MELLVSWRNHVPIRNGLFLFLLGSFDEFFELVLCLRTFDRFQALLRIVVSVIEDVPPCKLLV